MPFDVEPSESAAPHPVTVSVVVPTFNRMDTLPEVLKAICDQKFCGSAELIVVDDGSGEETRNFLTHWMDERRGQSSRFACKVLSQANAGPARARNAGVEEATGRLVAFLGDDTVPKSGWLQSHLDRHVRAAADGLNPERVGVIGYTGWHPRMKTNPFLRYINEHGLQFGYALIDDPAQVPFNFFYTSNLTVPRSALLAEPFDVEFPYAAWEDIEVSYRLHEAGFRLLYESQAVVDHDHPTSLERFADRQEKAGFCGVVFFRKHPELGGFLGLSPNGAPELPDEGAFRRKWRLVRNLQKLMEKTGWAWLAPTALSTLWEDTLRYYYIVGLRRGWSELNRKGAEAPEAHSDRPTDAIERRKTP